MKKLALAVAFAVTAIAPLAHGQTYGRYDRDAAPAYRDSDRDARARVIDSRPVYAQSGTHEECWNEETHRYEHHAINAGSVIGGIAGGVLGHQFGSGRGNTAATIAGAAGGAAIGNRVERNREEDRPSTEQRCRTVSDSDAGSDVIGYDVRYEYRGREYTARLDHQPGRWLDVGRDIREDGSPFDVAYDRR
jgi:uncharacterized protein YcfJ